MLLTSEVDKVVVLELVDSLKLAAHIVLLGSLVEELDSRVLLVSSKDLLSLESPALSQMSALLVLSHFHPRRSRVSRIGHSPSNDATTWRAFHPVDSLIPRSLGAQITCHAHPVCSRGISPPPLPQFISVVYVLVRLVDIIDRQDGEVAVVAEIAQGDAGAGLEAEFGDGFFRHIEGDGHGEEEAGSEAVLLDDAVWGKSPVLVGCSTIQQGFALEG